MTDINILVDNETVIDDISSCKIGMSDSSFCMTVDIQFINQRLWNICDPLSKFGELRIKVVIGDTTYQFLLEDRNTTSNINGVVFSIWGRSAQALLASPFSEIIKDTDATFHIWQTDNYKASDIVEYAISNFMNGRSATVNWNVEDFMVYQNSLSISGQFPIDLIGSLANVIGAQLSANIDGSLSVESYSVTEGESVASYNDLDEIFSMGETIVFPSGYNAVTVHGLGDTAVGSLSDTSSYLGIQDLSGVDFYVETETIVKCYYYHSSLIPQCYFPKGSYRYLTTGADEITEDVTFRYGTGSTSRPNTSGKSEVTYGNAIVEVREVEYATNYVSYAIKPNSAEDSVLAFYFSDRSGEVDTTITPTSSRIGTTGSGLDSLVIDWDLCGSAVLERHDSNAITPGSTVWYRLYYRDALLTPVITNSAKVGFSSRTGGNVLRSESVNFTNGEASVDYPIRTNLGYTPVISFTEIGISPPVTYFNGSNKIYCQEFFDNAEYSNVQANVSYRTSYVLFYFTLPSTYSSTDLEIVVDFQECSNNLTYTSTVSGIDNPSQTEDVTLTVNDWVTGNPAPNVDVWVDDVYYGQTNSQGIINLPGQTVGTHGLKMTALGYIDSDKDDLDNDGFTVS